MQLSLFDNPIQPTAPFVATSETSREAAEEIAPITGELRQRVYCYISEQPNGATDEECQIGLNMPANTQRPRRIELERMGWIEKNGTRKTRSGRDAAVWCAKR